MKRIRGIAALAFVAILGLAPIAGEWCIANCEGSGAAPGTSAHCHRAASHGLRLSQVPSACGHDHQIVAVARTTEAVRLLPMFFAHALPALAGTLRVSADLRFAAATSRAGPRSPDTRSIPLTLSSSLRI